jgi:molecular chaperone DnaK
MARDNRTVGRFILDGIPPAQRGTPQIEVTFDIDANGILTVTSKDKGTGKEQSVRIEASTGLTPEEIEKMRAEAAANADSDRIARERAEKLNTADNMIFTTEKQLKEYGDKLSAGNKTAIEGALNELKAAHQAQDVDAIDATLAKLEAAWQAASQEIYQATQQAGGEPAQDFSGNGGGSTNAGGAGSDDVTDVEYEEIEKK